MSNTVNTLAHVWAAEQDAQAAQAQVDTALGFPSGDTLHYQSIQYQDGTGWWMQADGNTVSVLGMGQLQVIQEQVIENL